MLKESEIETLDALAAEVSSSERISEDTLFSASKNRRVTAARHKLFYTALKFGFSAKRIAEYYGFLGKTVGYGAQVHAEKNGLPKLVEFDLERHLERHRADALERKRRKVASK
jgi:hypothetical protein